MDAPVPVIAIDGPSASGKGTVAQRVARSLGYHYLDSGALYRLVALAALWRRISLADVKGLEGIAASLDVVFTNESILLQDQDVTEEIRTEECSRGASGVAACPAVRLALLERQRRCRRLPGLVAEGRDMGSVVFPDARLKVFLTASPEARAERRHKQLKQKGIVATLPLLLQDLRERDERDETRSVAPLKPSPEALWLDTSAMSPEEAVQRILGWYADASSKPAANSI